jgi:hypothetical protein
MTIVRLHMIVEGQTEQSFVQNVLSPHLAAFNVFADARSVLTSKDTKAHKEYRGGLIGYQKARADIVTWLKEDQHPECRFATMFDLYALPADFPCYADAAKLMDPYARVLSLESAFGKDINDRRFIPYIQLHEFEALILADPKQIDWEYLDHDHPIGNLVKMVGTQNPELINDGFETAPSKRILKEIPEYDKVTSGVSIVQKIGLPALRQKCRHFSNWLQKLEQEGQPS